MIANALLVTVTIATTLIVNNTNTNANYSKTQYSTDEEQSSKIDRLTVKPVVRGHTNKNNADIISKPRTKNNLETATVKISSALLGEKSSTLLASSQRKATEKGMRGI